MSKFTLDLQNYVSNFSDPVDPGDYTARVIHAELGKTKAGDQKISAHLEIIEGPFKGSVVIDNLNLTGGGMFKIVMLMKAIGLPTPKKRMNLDTAQFVGKMVRITVVNREYNGNTYPNIQDYRPHSAPESAPVEEDDLDDFEDAYEDEVEEAPEPAPVQRKRRPAPKPEPVVEEEDDEYEDDLDEYEDDLEEGLE